LFPFLLVSKRSLWKGRQDRDRAHPTGRGPGHQPSNAVLWTGPAGSGGGAFTAEGSASPRCDCHPGPGHGWPD